MLHMNKGFIRLVVIPIVAALFLLRCSIAPQNPNTYHPLKVEKPDDNTIEIVCTPVCSTSYYVSCQYRQMGDRLNITVYSTLLPFLSKDGSGTMEETIQGDFKNVRKINLVSGWRSKTIWSAPE